MLSGSGAPDLDSLWLQMPIANLKKCRSQTRDGRHRLERMDFGGPHGRTGGCGIRLDGCLRRKRQGRMPLWRDSPQNIPHRFHQHVDSGRPVDTQARHSVVGPVTPSVAKGDLWNAAIPGRFAALWACRELASLGDRTDSGDKRAHSKDRKTAQTLRGVSIVPAATERKHRECSVLGGSMAITFLEDAPCVRHSRSCCSAPHS